MRMDDLDWSGGFNDADPTDFEDDDESYALTLDGGDGGDDADDDADDNDDNDDNDDDDDGETEEEKKLNCIAQVIICGVENFTSGLNPSENTIVLTALNKAASLGLPNDADVLKAFFILVVSRNKSTGAPFLTSSTVYNNSSQGVQNEIRNAISTWDNTSDSDLWGFLSTALGDDTINTLALQVDLISTFELTRIVTNAEHTAVDNFINSWGSAAMVELVTGTLVGIVHEEGPGDAATFLKTYQASGLGAPPFALGSQSLLAAIAANELESYADALQKCADDGGDVTKCDASGPTVG